MRINDTKYRTIWKHPANPAVIQVIDQRFLPHKFVIEDLTSCDAIIKAIKDMHVRGAPLIGAAAAYGVYLATIEACIKPDPKSYIAESCAKLIASRPTAINLAWAVNKVSQAITVIQSSADKVVMARNTADAIVEEEEQRSKTIGEHGLSLIRDISRKKGGKPVNILTHCNAGWLACIDYGTATAPVYLAAEQGIALHVWVDETRPRNQGASLTAFELSQEGVAHTVIADNTGGLLMQRGEVDIVIVGTDRTTKAGDVANKIGTYLKALAAKDNNIPFYVALPSTSLDLSISDGLTEIPIEKRSEDEVKYIEGLCDGQIKRVLLTLQDSPALNYGFDITPARLITGFITERGICEPNEAALSKHFSY